MWTKRTGRGRRLSARKPAGGRRLVIVAALTAVSLLAACTATPPQAGPRDEPSPSSGSVENSASETSYTVTERSSTTHAAAPGSQPATAAPSSSHAQTSTSTSLASLARSSMTAAPVTTRTQIVGSSIADEQPPATQPPAMSTSTPPATAVKPPVRPDGAAGIELPGGGRVMFPGRTLVALYGHPKAASLGALGQQDLAAAITRAKRVAATYHGRVAGPVIPTFEIIATVATASPGADGRYSARTPMSTLKPWVTAASKAGMYVILDLQPGRANLLDQANAYVELLRLPNVGLAIDPEWKLGPGQRPLGQIGGVDAAEVNSVISWLSRLTAANKLPQKVLVLHQFSLSMLRDEHRIVTDNDNVAVLIHMDGQGSPTAKNGTWKAVISAAPPGVFFGWKNFFAMDTPMLNQAKTVARTPVPVMISYQ